jgi:hypothetical protein
MIWGNEAPEIERLHESKWRTWNSWIARLPRLAGVDLFGNEIELTV